MQHAGARCRTYLKLVRFCARSGEARKLTFALAGRVCLGGLRRTKHTSIGAKSELENPGSFVGLSVTKPITSASTIGNRSTRVKM